MASTIISDATSGLNGYAIGGIGSSTARIDPSSVLAGTDGTVVSYVAAQFLPMPHLVSTGSPPGGASSATTATAVGDLVILVVGLPGPPFPVPGFIDTFWLDPAVHAFVAIGTQTAASPITASVQVPLGPGFIGLHFNWQAACYGPATGLQATNPGVTLVR